ncbi:hydroxyneurosporene dehydrogenase [Dactylonectria macrodidyma]|uniref:Hydroxyneurosporene dehydrogenase n=1 Tax=Dactylonectria macrodidyma TaxID=307937 RepID=A0A9P9JAL0_9HYPO|nr:hydroxyneurosporene dehydrogenase [Dactylonectria macrodidyma]
MAPIPFVLGSSPEHYSSLGISPTTIEVREDGLRTTPERRGCWEWWYFDAHLSNGAKLVVVFYTKDLAKPNTGLNPRITIQLDTPDGRSWDVQHVFSPHEFTASKARCDVRLSAGEGKEPYIFRCNDHLKTVEIFAIVEGVEVRVHLTSTTEPWRPQTGYLLYGKEESDYFAWLPSVPHGKVTATYRVPDEEPVTADGHGYHDHNWGNVSLTKVINHWYWGRGAVGPYTFITASIDAERAYGDKKLNLFMLARNGSIVADDSTKVHFSASKVALDAATKRPIADLVCFEYRDGDVRYVLDYQRQKTILRKDLIDTISGIWKFLARLVGFDGRYLRFSGTVNFKKYEKEEVVEEYGSEALWDLMWFGKVFEQVSQLPVSKDN